MSLASVVAFLRRGRLWLVVLAVAVGAGTATIVFSAGPERDEIELAVVAEPEGPTGPPSAEVVESAMSSAFPVQVVACGRDSRGTAVAFEGGVVTNAHVVAGASEVRLLTPSGSSYDAIVVAFDPLQDLALLEVPGLVAPALEVARPNGGDQAVVLARTDSVDGEPGIEGVSAEIVRTINILIDDIYGEERQRRPGMALSAELGLGDSGAGVIDAQGRLVGIVFSTSVRSTDVAYAISALGLGALVASRSVDGVGVDVGPCR